MYDECYELIDNLQQKELMDTSASVICKSIDRVIFEMVKKKFENKSWTCKKVEIEEVEFVPGILDNEDEKSDVLSHFFELKLTQKKIQMLRFELDHASLFKEEINEATETEIIKMLGGLDYKIVKNSYDDRFKEMDEKREEQSKWFVCVNVTSKDDKEKMAKLVKERFFFKKISIKKLQDFTVLNQIFILFKNFKCNICFSIDLVDEFAKVKPNKETKCDGLKNILSYLRKICNELDVVFVLGNKIREAKLKQISDFLFNEKTLDNYNIHINRHKCTSVVNFFSANFNFDKKEFALFKKRGIDLIYDLTERGPRIWKSLFLIGGIGIAMVALGIVLFTVGSVALPPLTVFGIGLIIRGLLETFTVYKAYKTNQVSWEKYIFQKSIQFLSLLFLGGVMEVAHIGFFSLFTQASFTEHFFSELIHIFSQSYVDYTIDFTLQLLTQLAINRREKYLNKTYEQFFSRIRREDMDETAERQFRYMFIILFTDFIEFIPEIFAKNAKSFRK